MTVSTTITKNSYAANGTLHSFAYGFKIFADADLTVIVRSATGVEVTKTLNTHYVVTNAGTDSGGNVLFKFNTGTSSDAHFSTTDHRPANTQTVFLLRSLGKSQGTDYVENDPFPSTSHEDALDRLTFITQELQEEADRSMKLSKTNTMTSTEFTTSATDRASKILAFDSSGELSVTQELGTFKGNSATTTTAAFKQRDIVKATTTAQLNNIYINVADSVIGDALTDTDHFAVLVDAVAAAASATTATTKASEASTSAGTATTKAAESVAARDASVVAKDASVVAKDAAVTAKNAAEAAKTLAETALDNFDDIFLGAKSSDPSTDNDGDALTAGDLYFNTTSSVLKVYNGSAFETIDTFITGIANTNIPVFTSGVADNDFLKVAGTSIEGRSSSEVLSDIGGQAALTFGIANTNIPKFTSGVADDDFLRVAGTTIEGRSASELLSDIGASAVAGSSSIVTTGALNAGSITSDFGTINNGASAITTTGVGSFGSLDISGNIDVDGTTNLDVVDIDGAVNFSADVTFADGADIITASAGTSNTRIGVNTGNTIASGGNFNVLIGDEAGTALTTGDNNVAVGFEALKTEDAHGANVAIGYQALKVQDAGATAYNVAVGHNAGSGITSGIKNTLIGGHVGDALTDADNNTAIGFGALSTDRKGSRSTAVGDSALATQNFANATMSNNTAVGFFAGNDITSGVNNTLIGSEAGEKIGDADNNTAVGFEALGTNVNGSASVAIGFGALKTQNYGSATDGLNVAVGNNAGKLISTGIQNALVGALAGDALDDADFNVAFGYNALTGDTLGSRSTAIGRGALATQNFTSATDTNNTAVGFGAGVVVSTGINNTLIGANSGDSLTDADQNTAVGFGSLTSDRKGSKSTAIGFQALATQNFANSTDSLNTAVGYNAGVLIQSGVENTIVGALSGDAITTGIRNVSVGSYALSTNQAGDQSVAVGHGALFTQNPSGNVDMNNTAVGHDAGNGVTTGISNTLIGSFAGALVNTGTKNTIIGRYTGNQDGLDIRTASNNIVLSDGDGFPRLHYIGSWRGQSDTASSWGYILDNINATDPFGLLIRTTASDDNDGAEAIIECHMSGTARFKVLNNGNVQNTNNSYGAVSDIKLKEQITDASSQWDDIKALTIRKFKMKQEVSAKGDSDSLWKLGVVAQEVETAGMNGLVSENIDRDEDLNDLGTTTKEVKYSILYMKAVKALQEAITRIETLEAKVTTLEGA